MDQQRVSLLFALGEFEEVLDLAEDLVERVGPEPNPRMLAAVSSYVLEVRLLRGQVDRVVPLLEELEAGIDGEIYPFSKGLRLVYSARIRAALGEREAAVALMTRFADERLLANRAVEVSVELGEPDLAERIAARYNDSVSTLFNATLIAEARGDLGAAAAGYPELVDYFRNSGDVIYLAKSLVGQGRVFTRLGRTSEAVAALNEARPILVRLEAAPMLAAVDALLEQLTALSA
jgi:tetratricopeptide (TPR) repeat protein